MVELLLKHGADANSTNDSGHTPLHFASGDGGKKNVELLLAHKAYVNAKSLNGDTPLILAVERLEKPVVELLLKHGANPNLATAQNETPLRIAQSGGSFLGKPGIRYGGASTSAQLSIAKEIAKLLIRYGADENYERRTQIAVTRDFKQVYPIFHKGTNSWNRFSLLEVFGMAYESANGERRISAFAFPNLAKVVIHRLEGKEEREIPVDLEAILKSGDCSKDIWLEWGDLIEIPEKDHKINEEWHGFPKENLEILPKCLSRNVSILVKGEAKRIRVAPGLRVVGSSQPGAVGISAAGQPIVSPGHIVPVPEQLYGPNGFDFWLNNVVSRSGLLRTSSDKTRVKVTRINPVTKKSEEQIFNLEKPDSQNQLWLRDGDRIEIPERDPNATIDARSAEKPGSP